MRQRESKTQNNNQRTRNYEIKQDTGDRHGNADLRETLKTPREENEDR